MSASVREDRREDRREEEKEERADTALKTKTVGNKNENETADNSRA